MTHGPGAETKEFVASLDLVECADLDEAIEVVVKVWPPIDGLWLGQEASAFGSTEDGTPGPYRLITWMGGPSAVPFNDRAVIDAGEVWRLEVEERAFQILGNAPESPDGPRTRRGDARDLGPFTDTKEFIARIDVVSCANRTRRSSSPRRIRSPDTTRLRSARSGPSDPDSRLMQTRRDLPRGARSRRRPAGAAERGVVPR